MSQEKYIAPAIKAIYAYMKDNNLSQAEFSRKIGCTYCTLWTWLTGARFPSLQTAIKIENLTDGFVPCTSWSKHHRKSANKTQKHQDDKKDSTT